MKVVWKRYRSPRPLVEVYFGGPDEAAPISEVKDVKMSSGAVWDGADFVKTVRGMGMWAFVDTHAKPPVVHYWHDGKRKPAELAKMLGHELGHVSGKPFKGRSTEAQWKEEMRADEYGEVAAEVVRHLLGGRR